MEVRGSDDGSDAVRVEFDTEDSDPSLSVVEAVASINDADSAELTPVYDCLDHVVDHLFSNPPDPEANVTISFDYEGFRVTIHQDGAARFVPYSSR